MNGKKGKSPEDPEENPEENRRKKGLLKRKRRLFQVDLPLKIVYNKKNN